ncbi:uncharacterized protein SETTUDRAFT_132354 [Exserohilum turcica Et28A]|uniref:RWD domain-containing protein n=1 Tax=Exserohilum turcicum (strain 28A) TaxID=671987 RepID=R0JXM1_EXST2|nr:uncharacterized protein SETTUDRAFT_132354 [Exserohilum turcica Et28A]EOA85648.1 hypothetical protein SETTUDRAFT_132354 [Exserohilum turcica Et28A]
MYPHQTHYNPNSRECKFASDTHASFLLRLPETYPLSGFPDIISATDAAKNDLREPFRDAVRELGLMQGEEVLDAIIAAFEQLAASAFCQSSTTKQNSLSTAAATASPETPKAIIVWLHHLLNTNKRKLALSPPPSLPPVSGLTKPGYPGVLVYSGPSSAVTEHVNLLKAQNWQAFQVRYEEDKLWTFAHGTGVKEMESMSDIVKGVEAPGHAGKVQKDEFLKAVGIK